MSVREFLEVKEAKQPPHVDSRVDQVLHDARKERDEAWERLVEIGNAIQLERGKEDMVEKVAGLASRLEKMEIERDDALDRHKQAHDRAMTLHVVIDQGVHVLREALSPTMVAVGVGPVKEAIHLLTREDLAGEAKSEVDVLRDNAIYWEAEAKERAQSQTDLENRMDEAAKLLEQYAAVFTPAAEEIRQALAILARDESDDPNVVDEGGE